MDLLEKSAVTDLSTWQSASRSPSQHISLCIWDTRHLIVTLTLSNTPNLHPSRTDISTLHKQFLQSREEIHHSCVSTILQQCIKLLHALIHSYAQSWFVLYWRSIIKKFWQANRFNIRWYTLWGSHTVAMMKALEWNNKNKLSEIQIFQYKLKIWMQNLAP
jgi:hypothetical protein